MDLFIPIRDNRLLNFNKIIYFYNNKTLKNIWNDSNYEEINYFSYKYSQDIYFSVQKVNYLINYN